MAQNKPKGIIITIALILIPPPLRPNVLALGQGQLDLPTPRPWWPRHLPQGWPRRTRPVPHPSHLRYVLKKRARHLPNSSLSIVLTFIDWSSRAWPAPVNSFLMFFTRILDMQRYFSFFLALFLTPQCSSWTGWRTSTGRTEPPGTAISATEWFPIIHSRGGTGSLRNDAGGVLRPGGSLPTTVRIRICASSDQPIDSLRTSTRSPSNTDAAVVQLTRLYGCDTREPRLDSLVSLPHHYYHYYYCNKRNNYIPHFCSVPSRIIPVNFSIL